MASYERKQHSGSAVATTLAGAISSTGAVTVSIASASGWPDTSVGPFVITIDRGNTAEEKCLVTARTGTSLTVTAGNRGYDGTSASTHALGVTVEHTYSAVEADEGNALAYRLANATSGLPFLGGGAATLPTAATVGTAGITDLAVTTAKIAAGAVTATELGTGAVTSAKILDGTIATADFAGGAVDATALGTGAVTSAKILDGTIATGDIAALAITTALLNTDAVTAAKIAADAVGSSELADNAVDTAAIADGAVTAAKLASGTGTVPTGVMLEYGGVTAPSGYLMCDGTAVSRTTYAALFTAIGVAFGAGNGSTTFNVPDYRGRVGLGSDTMGTSAAGLITLASSSMGQTIGTEKVTLDTTMIPSHSHTATDAGHTHDLKRDGTFTKSGSGTGVIDVGTASSGTSDGTSRSGTASITVGNTGGGLYHLNVQPSLTVYKIIKT